MKKSLIMLIALLCFSQGYSQRQETVMIYVDQNLWNSSGVPDAIYALRDHLAGWGNISIAGINTSFDANTPIETLRTDLYYAMLDVGVTGAIFIGNLPVAWYEIENDYGQYGYQDFPIDLYFMDLLNPVSNWLDNAHDGDWSGNAKTGKFDGYSGTPHADIWVSRIVPSVLTGISTNEVSIIQDYSNRAVNRLLGNDIYMPTTGVAIGNTDDWSGFETQMFQNLIYPAGSIATYTRPNDTGNIGSIAFNTDMNTPTYLNMQVRRTRILPEAVSILPAIALYIRCRISVFITFSTAALRDIPPLIIWEAFTRQPTMG